MYYPGCRRFIDKITYCRMWHLSLTRPTSTRFNEFLSSGIDWLHMCARVYASHLSHRCQRYKVSIMLKKSRSPRSSIEGFCPWKEVLSISWFEQLKSLVWWETKRNDCKILVHRQVNQEAMPIGTDRRLSGAWWLYSCRLHLLMHSTPLFIHWNDDSGFVCRLTCNTTTPIKYACVNISKAKTRANSHKR